MKIAWLVTNLSLNLGYSASHMPGGGVLFKFKAITFLIRTKLNNNKLFIMNNCNKQENNNNIHQMTDLDLS